MTFLSLLHVWEGFTLVEKKDNNKNMRKICCTTFYHFLCTILNILRHCRMLCSTYRDFPPIKNHSYWVESKNTTQTTIVFYTEKIIFNPQCRHKNEIKTIIFISKGLFPFSFTEFHVYPFLCSIYTDRVPIRVKNVVNLFKTFIY